MDLDLFSRYLTEELERYTQFSKIMLKGVYWEEVIVKSLNKFNYKIDWNSDSHKSGPDININNGEYLFSAKSGVVEYNKLIFSSFRSTKYKTLEEKIIFFDDVGKKFTHYLIIVRNKNNTAYDVYMINSDLILASFFTWEELFRQKDKNSSVGWKTNIVNGVDIQIRKAMSDQFWIAIDKSILKNNKKIKLLTRFIIPNKANQLKFDFIEEDI
jgi:hypothetical protein